MEELQGLIGAFLQVAWVKTGLLALVILVATALLARLATRFLRHVLAVNEEKDLPSTSIFVNIGRGAVWVLGVCVTLSTCFNVDVSAAIAALGIGGIAISLGFQDTIANLIGGLQVSLLGIVKPGDHIEVGSSSGVVKDVTWRHTTIKNGLGEEVLIPNSIINKTALTHLPPVNQASLSFVVVADGERLGEVADLIQQKACEAARSVGSLTKDPKVSFSEIVEGGFKGSVSFRVADSRKGGAAVDAVLRAIAPLTRSAAETPVCAQAPERGGLDRAGRNDAGGDAPRPGPDRSAPSQGAPG